MSRHGRAIRFIESYCPAPKGEGHGKPLKLGWFQKTWLEEALATGIDAAAMPSGAGNGKSSFGGGVATWATFDEDETGAPQVPILATTIGQAIRSCYGVAASMVRNSPELASRSIEFTGVATPRIFVPINEGSMFPISNDLDGLQGLDPSLTIVDELGFQPLDVWSAIRLRGGKRSRSLAWGTGTPGFDKDNALWHIRQRVLEGHQPPRMAWREYAAEPGCRIDDRRQWHKANPALRAGFLRMSALEEDLIELLPSRFRIFRLGQWVEGVEGWLGDDGYTVLTRLRSTYRLVPGAPTWVGVDVGIKRDSSAITAVQYRTDRPDTLHSTTRIWTPTKDEPIDVTDLMAHLRILTSTYRVGAVSFDPRFFDVPAKFLYDEGLPMIEIPQSIEHMTPAAGDLYERIHNGLVSYTPDPLFEEQVLNAVPRFNERGFTLSKGKSRGRIDACIALALAVDRATHKQKPRAPLVVL
jgi:phage terminase large subunit-like protein